MFLPNQSLPRLIGQEIAVVSVSNLLHTGVTREMILLTHYCQIFHLPVLKMPTYIVKSAQFPQPCIVGKLHLSDDMKPSFENIQPRFYLMFVEFELNLRCEAIRINNVLVREPFCKIDSTEHENRKSVLFMPFWI